MVEASGREGGRCGEIVLFEAGMVGMLMTGVSTCEGRGRETRNGKRMREEGGGRGGKRRKGKRRR